MLRANDILLYFVYKYKGNVDDVMTALRDKEEVDVDEVLDVVKNTKTKYITILDNEYPECLKKMDRPPVVLFYEGDFSLLKQQNNKLAVNGDEEPSLYGEKHNKEIVDGLTKDYLIISGGNPGQDTISIQETLENGLKNIVVLPCGLKNVLPRRNKELFQKVVENGGLLISEYHEDLMYSLKNDTARNRIIAGLCDVLLITEAYNGNDRDANLLVGCALIYGKDVACIPYEAGKNSFCNELIKEGAYMVEKAEDLVNISFKDNKLKNEQKKENKGVIINE